jgi:hypothetical protein
MVIASPYLEGGFTLFNYETAKQYQGKTIRFKNEKGDWVIGKVIKVNKDGLEIEEFNTEVTEDGFGYGFFGPRPYFRPRPYRRPYAYRPYRRPFVRYPFTGIAAIAVLPFFFW